ncbi:hypothetical protein BHE74_00030801 [Ensete ventricosum]|nr:hypothetical protein GW17_00028656 [Ensete ventricosum]RWW62092.1 hypothetical protein BHE74_00030801 [Ensete ventricosum]RZS04896.1 hypothetical protein BHM03_00035288 [Ensete ventricosum]
MNLLKDIVDSFSEFFSRAPAASDRSPPPAPDRMEPSPSTAPAVVGERVALKLKGYFDLAKQEIDKAVRAEEWGLTEDAVAHYRNAQRVMLEAKAARVPDALSSRSTILWTFGQRPGEDLSAKDIHMAGAGCGKATSANPEDR